MKVIGALQSRERTERHTVEFPIPFQGAPSAKFMFEFTGSPTGFAECGPVACSAVVTGWRGQEHVKAAWVLVSIERAPDAPPWFNGVPPFRIHYEFEGERGTDGDT